VTKQSNTLKFALLGLCFAVSFPTALGADATKLAAKPVAETTQAVSSQDKSAKPFGITFAVGRRKGGISRFSQSDDALGRHVSRFSGPPGPTLTVPGATFLRGPLSPAQLGQLFSESVEISEGEVLYDFPPGTAIRKVVATQTAQKK
jgi:hypothetical protein